LWYFFALCFRSCSTGAESQLTCFLFVDDCEVWYHFECVLLKPAQAKHFDAKSRYACPLCCTASGVKYSYGAASAALTTARPALAALTQLLFTHDMRVASCDATTVRRAVEVEALRRCQRALSTLVPLLQATLKLWRNSMPATASPNTSSVPLPLSFGELAASCAPYAALICVDCPELLQLQQFGWLHSVQTALREAPLASSAENGTGRKKKQSGSRSASAPVASSTATRVRALPLTTLRKLNRTQHLFIAKPQVESKADAGLLTAATAAPASAPSSASIADVPEFVGCARWVLQHTLEANTVHSLILKAFKEGWCAQEMANHSLLPRFPQLQQRVREFAAPLFASTAPPTSVQLLLHPQQSEVDEAAVISCVCGKLADDSLMVACDLCTRWFHARCVLPDRSASAPSSSSEPNAQPKSKSSSKQSIKEREFVCDTCKARAGGASQPMLIDT
jgi:hypothetical protein